jgi:hypothetical protein
VSVTIRFIFAIILSLVTLGVTLAWYHYTDPLTPSESSEVLAEILYLKNEVNKKPRTRLVWKALDVGDKIHNGEAVRTQSQSDMVLKFPDGTELKVEPDTFIILSKKENKIGLNLLEGSLMTSRAGSGQGDALVLESESGDIDLSKNSSTVISKVANEKVQLNVLDDKKPKDFISVLNPKPGSEIFFEKDQPLKFKLLLPQNLDKSTLEVRIGPSRKKLVLQKETLTFAGEDDVLLNLPSGEFFIKFTGRGLKPKQSESQDILLEEYESTILRYETTEIQKPEIIFPKAKSEFRRDSDAFIILGNVVKSAKKTRYALVGPENFVSKGELDKKSQSRILIEPGGPYYLALESEFVNGQKLKSETVSFHVLPDEVKEKPPFDLSLLDVPSSHQNPVLPYTMNIKWDMSVRQDEISFVSLEIRSVKKTKKTLPLPFEKKQVEISLEEFTSYELQALGLDASKQEITRTPVSFFLLEKTPLVGPVLHSYKKPVVTDGSGSTTVTWEKLKEAEKGYHIEFKKQGQKVSEEFKLEPQITQHFLESLLPGFYQMKIYPLDQWGRLGLSSAEIRIEVPEISSIKAPTTKKVKIK